MTILISFIGLERKNLVILKARDRPRTRSTYCEVHDSKSIMDNDHKVVDLE